MKKSVLQKPEAKRGCRDASRYPWGVYGQETSSSHGFDKGLSGHEKREYCVRAGRQRQIAAKAVIDVHPNVRSGILRGVAVNECPPSHPSTLEKMLLERRAGQPRHSPLSVVVFRALQLGDLLCVVPALRALRKALPTAHITLVSLPWAKTFVHRFSSYLDEFVEFPGYPGLPEREVNEARMEPFFKEMRSRHFDLAIQMHGSGPIVNNLVERFQADHQAGFFTTAADRPAHGTFIEWQHDEHEVTKFVRLVQALEIPPQGFEMEFPLYDADRAEHERTKAEHGLRAPYVCVHPGARMRSRRWLPERFAAVADTLASRGFQVVLTGSNDELDLVGHVASCMQSPPLILAGKTSLGGLAALLEEATLLVCNDTGISHVIAGVGTPSVVLTMGSDPVRWAPIDSRRHPAIFEAMSCRPCAFDECPIGHPCARKIEVETVVAAVNSLLERSAPCVPSVS